MPIWTDAAATETVLFNGGARMVLTPEKDVPAQLWNYNAVTSQELIDEGLRGVFNGGIPEAVLVESGVSSHALLIEDSQQYYTPKGFLAYYGPHIEDAEGYIIPASPFVAGLAIRRSRAQGFQFPPAGVSYPLNGTTGPQISISSAEQDVSNRLGMNALRTLPGYGNTVFVWGGRTRVNAKDADQGLYKFVNTRVILNVIYGTLKGAFDSQIFSVVDGRNLLFTKIRTISENILYVFWAGGALFGEKPSDAYAVVCDRRNNPGQTLEEGLVYLSVFVTPVPTLERIQIDLVRVAIDDMAKTLEARGFGS
jgi:phage tail sheath protein FI